MSAATAKEKEIWLLAQTLFGEARGEGRKGMESVAQVILNRMNHPRRWPNDIVGVIKQRLQFSAWNQSDPNRKLMLAVTEADPQFRLALKIAREAVEGRLKDHVKGADHYHTIQIARPAWSRGKTPVVTIGNHHFFKLG